jgi:hypothetical protein
MVHQAPACLAAAPHAHLLLLVCCCAHLMLEQRLSHAVCCCLLSMFSTVPSLPAAAVCYCLLVQIIFLTAPLLAAALLMHCAIAADTPTTQDSQTDGGVTRITIGNVQGGSMSCTSDAKFVTCKTCTPEGSCTTKITPASGGRTNTASATHTATNKVRGSPGFSDRGVCRGQWVDSRISPSSTSHCQWLVP